VAGVTTPYINREMRVREEGDGGGGDSGSSIENIEVEEISEKVREQQIHNESHRNLVKDEGIQKRAELRKNRTR
jgi:hypothetical protein